MADFNKVIFLGRLTHDIKFGYMPNEIAVADFSLAVNRYYTDSSGKKQDEVLFIDCRAFGQIAEYLKKNVQKGSPIFVEGHLKLEIWTSKKTTTKQRKYRVIVEHFSLLTTDEKTETTPETEPKDDISQRRSGTERPRKALAEDEIPF